MNLLERILEVLSNLFEQEREYPLATGDKGLDIAIHQTVTLTENRNRVPEDNAAKFLAQALQKIGVEYNITKDYWTVDPPTDEPHGDGNLEWWQEADKEYDAQDVNLLIMYAEGNGLAYVGGRYALAPGALVDRDLKLKTHGSSDAHRNTRACLHESGHNLGCRHEDNMFTPPKMVFNYTAVEVIREYTRSRYGPDSVKSDE